MTPKSFAVVACRLLAIWYFVQAVRDFVTPLSKVWGSGSFLFSFKAFLYIGSLPLAEVSASFILWLGAFIIAQNVTHGVETEVSESSEIGIAGWQAIGFSLIGMFTALQGFIDLLFSLVRITVLSDFSANSFFRDRTTDPWTQLVAAMTQFIIGFALLLYAQKTIQVLDYLQRAGRDDIVNANREV